MNHPVVGIDVSKRFSNVCILSENNQILEQFKIPHDLKSFQHCLLKLQKIENQVGVAPIVVMESTSHYHRIVWKFFIESGYQTIVINPIQSNALKNISVRKIKNDKVDAYRIALLYRLGTLKGSNIPIEEMGALRSLSRQHHEIKLDIVSYTNRLMAMLDQTFPSYERIFSRITAKSSLAILEKYPTPTEMLQVGKEELVEIIRIHSLKGRAFASRKADLLLKAAQEAVKLGFSQSSDGLIIRTIIATIRLLNANIETIDTEMQRVIEQNKHLSKQLALLQSIPSIGLYSAIVILSELGDIKAFAKPKQLVAFFGLDPTQRQSGSFFGTKNKISKRGSSHVRAVLNMIAHNNVHINKSGKALNPVLAEHFNKKSAEKPVKVALCAVMHKLVKIIFAVLRDQKPFELRAPESHAKLLLFRPVAA